MGRQPKRIRNLKRTEKDFPICREQILTQRWIPHVVCDSNGAYWDGFTAKDGAGRLVGPISDAARKQMINMILDGHYGEEVKDALIDANRYEKIRDNLITWPNKEIIEEQMFA